MITANELREKYLKFFEKKGHTIIPSASLIPENDPSTLFISAGMQPLVPYLLGEKHPAGKRLVNSQKCIRTGDIDDVGDSYHHTFFEMMGHWSLGDYFKEEAIKMSYEFLTTDLGLDITKLAFSVFAGNENSTQDEVSAKTWKELGVSENRIVYLSEKENWWEPAGTSGPCGPSTEMFYWSDNSISAPQNFDAKDKRWIEIGNDVLMEYEKIGQNKYKSANQKNIDNGTGLERTLAVINGLDDNYKTELFWPIILEIEKLSNKRYGDDENITRSIRIITDHLKAATFILGDPKAIAPSNLDQGYVLRRLIRRAIRHGKMIGVNKPFTFKIAEIIIKEYLDSYPELLGNKDFIIEQLAQEEEKFSQTLEKGLKQFEKLSSKDINAHDAFILFSTYGFPLEMTQELATEKGINVDEAGFKKEFAKHQELSRTGAQGKFKGGLADSSEITARMHTAAHLMLSALRKVLGDHVYQKGSNITPERIRFDFSHGEKMTDEQKKQVENLVNEQIEKNIPVECEEVSLDEAKTKGAMGVFESKYGDKVKVYKVGDFSLEICGGPHAKNTGELGHFIIKKEESSSSGVRRIKAILE